MICKTCGTIQAGKTATPGSIWIELVLWLAFIVPGLIYSLWRHSKRGKVCATCGSAELIAEDSPVGRKLVQEHYPHGVVVPTAPARGLAHWLTVLLLSFLGAVMLVMFVVSMLATGR